MALSDQLATQAVPSGRARGVQARSSHPEMTGHHLNTLGCAEHFLPGVRRYGDGRTTVRDTLNNDRARAWANGDRVRATVAFLHGVVCPPCHAYARTARVVLCTAYGLTVTERSRAGGGSDPREGWSPSRADPGGILISADWAKAPHPWPADVRTKLCGVGARRGCCNYIMFLPLRLSRPKIHPTSLRICLSPGLAFHSLTSGPKLFQKT